MKFTIKDHRSENRTASTQRDITGAVTEAPPSYWDSKPRSENYDRRKTHDNREVSVVLEPEDYVGDLAVPDIIQGQAVGKHGGEFFARRIIVRLTRSYDNGDGSSDNWGRYGSIHISGPNRRADGTEGAKDNGKRYPVIREADGPDTWTLKDVEESTWNFQLGDTLPDYKLALIGTPKKIRVVDPLPGWLAAIVDRVHPRTGLPFAYPDEHRFGDFK
jgi:hypothetical protein